MDRLVTLIEECDQRGIIVDVTFTRGGRDWAVVPHTHTQHKSCVQTTCTYLKNHVQGDQRNFYFDLDNESAPGVDHPPQWPHITAGQIGELRAIVEGVDPDWLCTCSFVQADFTPVELPGLVLQYLTVGNIDFITPHLERWEASAESTVTKVRQYRDWMKPGNPIGIRVPIHLQEPFRRGAEWDSWEANPIHFFRDCTGGKVGGAAGWCFHTDAGFNLTVEGFYDRLDSVEGTVVDTLTYHLGSTYAYARRYQAEYPEQLWHGTTGAVDGWGWGANTASHSAGLLNWGPYDDMLHEGDYSAFFRMQIDDITGLNNAVVIVDAFYAQSHDTLAIHTVRRWDFNAADTSQDFALPFNHYDDTEELEFRTRWLDVADIWLDHIEVMPAAGQMTLTGRLVGGDLQLTWTETPGSAEYWVYGADNLAYFEPGFAPGYEHRLAELPVETTTWTSPNGVGGPDHNWTYMVLAVNSLGVELCRSNRFGEHDFRTDVP